ncbi:hypothetical protein AcW2_000324 [Taiwanofungus camphoratus]|nr:hypothetical protein AcW2_000324 [Antrodia cinnamomea]
MSLILGKRRHSCLPGDSNHVLQPLTKRARSAYDRQSFHDSGRTTSQAVRIYYSQPQVRESVAAGRQNEAWLTEDCEKHASAVSGLLYRGVVLYLAISALCCHGTLGPQVDPFMCSTQFQPMA